MDRQQWAINRAPVQLEVTAAPEGKVVGWDGDGHRGQRGVCQFDARREVNEAKLTQNDRGEPAQQQARKEQASRRTLGESNRFP